MLRFQSGDRERKRAVARRAASGALAAVADEVLATDAWWGQQGGNSVEEQLLADLRKDGAHSHKPSGPTSMTFKLKLL